MEHKGEILLSIKDLNVYYGGIQALHGISLDINCLLYTSPSPRDA